MNASTQGEEEGSPEDRPEKNPEKDPEKSAVSWRALLRETTTAIGESAPARWLCEAASGLTGDEFLSELDQPVTLRMVAHLDSMVARYRSGEPLAYVLGYWSFRHIDVMVDRRVLIPRPETEVVAGRAIELAALVSDPVRRIADLGTGSGVIGLSIASEMSISGTEVWLTDAVSDALDVARANAAGLGRRAANVRIAEGEWFAALPEDLAGSFDVVVSNPPYIADDDSEIDPSVCEWEPGSALFAGSDGLRDLRIIVGEAQTWLRPGGWLIVEIGYGQGSAVEQLFVDSGFVDVRVGQDLTGRDRYVEGRRPASC
jgi:release factor glutamine methyltransferase